MYYLCALSLILSGCQAVSNMITGAGVHAVMLEPHITCCPPTKVVKETALAFKAILSYSLINRNLAQRLWWLFLKFKGKKSVLKSKCPPTRSKTHLVLSMMSYFVLKLWLIPLLCFSPVSWPKFGLLTLYGCWRGQQERYLPTLCILSSLCFLIPPFPHFCQGGPLTRFPLQILKGQMFRDTWPKEFLKNHH